ncbi:MAG: alpha/beta fold hydrolase, partial [Massilia sp.]
DSAFPAAGDILLYQARGQGIRDFIGRRIDQLKAKEVIILAHSLGGIACVELLAQHTPGHVKRLVTFGSQAPFFHELGALVTIEPGDSLPAHFPSWSNFYDLNDPLSYIASKVFSGDVSDYRVESGESFPASHSAYLHSTPFWQQLKALLHDA